MIGLSSTKYLTAEGFKSIWSHRLMSIASIGVLIACMLMMGIALLLSLNVDKALGSLENQNVVMVFFSDDLNDEQALQVSNEISLINNVEKSTYISKEEGLERQKAILGDEYSELFEFIKDENPLPNGAQVVMQNLDKFDQTILAIEQVNGVKNINQQRDIAVKLMSVRTIINNASIWIIALLLIISLAIVANTIRIAMFSRKLEINIMKAVGATNSFIRIPFMIEGMLLGIIASLLSTGLLYFIYKAATTNFENTFNTTVVPFTQFALPLLGGFVLIGAVTGVLASIFSIGKYLKREGSEFSAIS